MITKNWLLTFGFFCSSLFATYTVNKVNGGLSLSYLDFSVPGSVLPLDLQRTYNSITAIQENAGWNGAFGWGWTTAFESILTVTPEKQVILRDGFTGNTITFKAEKEDPKAREEFLQKIKLAYFQNKTGRKLKTGDLERFELPEKILTRLKSDPQFRVDLALKLGLKGETPKGEFLISSEYGLQSMHFENGQWVREKDQISQYYDSEGRLVRQKDKNGFQFELKYNKLQKYQVAEIASPENGTSLKITWKKEKVSEVQDNRGKKAKYIYDTHGNLVQSQDSNGVAFKFLYENKKFPHLLTKVEYLSETVGTQKPYRELRYDENGLVTFVRDKDATENQYSYGRKAQDSENNFWTKTIAKKSNGTQEESYDEYTLKARPDGSKYLYRQETKQNNQSTITLFAPCCSKPLQIVKNGQTTSFKYYNNGLLEEKNGPNESVFLEYDPRWRKVTKVVQNNQTSLYSYDKQGNLIKAVSPVKEEVKIAYDKFGRIQDLEAVKGKKIEFRYGALPKPTLISQKGIGSIRIEYDSDGRILKTETLLSKDHGRKPSAARSQEVVRQIMTEFQHFLDILRPAGVSLSM